MTNSITGFKNNPFGVTREFTHRYFPTPGGASISLKVETTSATFVVVDVQEFFTKFWAKKR